MDNDKIVDKTSIIPIYYQLFKYIEKQIRVGKLSPGDAIPTEMEFAERFDISRMTVRRAISELVSAGMVYAQKGKGTFVAKPKLDNVVFDLNNFYSEVEQKGMEHQTKLLEARIIKADQVLARRMGIAVNTKCLMFRIVTTANGEPLVYEVRYTVYAKKKPILESELKDASLSNLAAAHSDTVPSRSKKILMASKTIDEESKVLGVKPDTSVFLMIQYIYDDNNETIAWGKSVFRGDRYKLISFQGWNVEDIPK